MKKDKIKDTDILDAICALYLIPRRNYTHILTNVIRDQRDAKKYRKLRETIMKEINEESGEQNE